MKQMLIVFFLCLSSCNFILGVKELGAGYYFDNDQILYTEKEQYNGVGLATIPPRVIDVKKNSDFIIVNSLNNLNLNQYWIIFKNKNKQELKFNETDGLLNSYYKYSNIIGPIELDSFNYLLERDKITLSFGK